MRNESSGGPARRAFGELGLVVAGAVTSAGVNLFCSLVAKEWVYEWRWPLTLIVLVAFVAPVVWQRRKLGGLPALRAVTAVDTGEGSMDVFVVTRSGRVLYASYREHGAWSAWVDMDAPPGEWDVTAVVPTLGSVECFVVDGHGVLHMRRRDRGQWSRWRVVRPGGIGAGRPIRIVAAGVKAGHREIYAVTDKGHLVHAWRWDHEDWSDWYDSGLKHCADVAACSPKDDLIECFAVDRDGDVRHRWFWWDRWHEWENWGHPGSPARAITAFRKATDLQEMFVVGKAGDLAHRWHAGGQAWSEWAVSPTPGDLVDVAASTTSANTLQCLAIDTQGELWQTTFADPWQAWSEWRLVTEREHVGSP